MAPPPSREHSESILRRPAYFGQRFLTNNLTGSWEASPRATLSLTYRYRTHMIAENLFASTGSGATFVITDPGGNPGNIPLAPGATNDGTVTINENGGIFNVALRPTSNWELNGTIEALYDDNAFTPVGPRQTRHYRCIHGTGLGPGRRCRVHSTTWSGITTPITRAQHPSTARLTMSITAGLEVWERC